MYNYRAIVTKIVDGDTIDVSIDLGFHVWVKQRLRLARVNTPERGQPGFWEATNRVSELCPVGSEIQVKTYKTGKFGRWIAEVFFKHEGLLEHQTDGPLANLSDVLLKEELGKPYGK